MYVMMAVNVVSKACQMCPRLKVAVLDEYRSAEVVQRDLECVNYDDCLNALDMWQRGRAEKDDGKEGR